MNEQSRETLKSLSAATAAQLDWIYHLMKMTEKGEGRESSEATTAKNWERWTSSASCYREDSVNIEPETPLSNRQKMSETRVALLAPFRTSDDHLPPPIDTTVHEWMDTKEQPLLHSSGWLSPHNERDSCTQVSPLTCREGSLRLVGDQAHSNQKYWIYQAFELLLDCENSARQVIYAVEDRDRSTELDAAFTRMATAMLGRLTLDLLAENKALRKAAKNAEKARFLDSRRV